MLNASFLNQLILSHHHHMQVTETPGGTGGPGAPVKPIGPVKRLSPLSPLSPGFSHLSGMPII